MTAAEQPGLVTVSRRIAAPAHVIFAVLATPQRHVEMDGSGMLRGSLTSDSIPPVGDVFVMNLGGRPYGEDLRYVKDLPLMGGKSFTLWPWSIPRGSRPAHFAAASEA